MTPSNSQSELLLVGPYITNYSFAKVNRNLAQALDRLSGQPYKVVIWDNPPSGIDKLPDAQDWKLFPDLKRLVGQPQSPDVTIYSGYPGNGSRTYGFNELPGKLKLIYLGWEESVFPAEWIEEINRELHAVVAISHFTAEILKRNGIKLPIFVANNAFDPVFVTYKPQQFPLQTNKKFKFLHVSTARMRKGIDVLLKAYFDEFDGDDDVSLIIKSFPGPDNLVNNLLGELSKQYPNAPEVIHIFDPNLTEHQLIDLTYSCDAAVYPTRAEGFGLPIAEAMYLSKPVIVTAYSGQMDFCNNSNCLLLDFELADAVTSEHTNVGAKWAEPNQQQLAELMRKCVSEIDQPWMDELKQNAHRDVQSLTWENSATQIDQIVKQVRPLVELKQKHLAVLSIINGISGISEYNNFLYQGIEASFGQVTYLGQIDTVDQVNTDRENVVRIWDRTSSDWSQVYEWLDQNRPNILHIQHHSGEIELNTLAQLIEKAASLKIEVVVTLHIVRAAGVDLSSISEQLNKAHSVLVHNGDDLNYLVSKGVTTAHLFPLPTDEAVRIQPDQLKKVLGWENRFPIIATHGLMSDHKGILETAAAVAELKSNYPNILWLAVNAVNINNITSSSTADKLEEAATELQIQDNLVLFKDFLTPDQISALLQISDIGLLAYKDVGESSSAAVHKFLHAGTATIVTNIGMFKSVVDGVYRIEDNSAESIKAAIQKLATDEELRINLRLKARQTAEKFSWSKLRLEFLQQLI